MNVNIRTTYYYKVYNILLRYIICSGEVLRIYLGELIVYLKMLESKSEVVASKGGGSMLYDSCE